MTPEQQRIAIAEACGWKYHYSGDGYAFHAEHCTNGKYTRPPDYLNDLNAMHEAENTLTKEQQDTMAAWLYCGKNCTFQDFCTNRSVWIVLHITASQRAEAFLRTLNLYIP